MKVALEVKIGTLCATFNEYFLRFCPQFRKKREGNNRERTRKREEEEEEEEEEETQTESRRHLGTKLLSVSKK